MKADARDPARIRVRAPEKRCSSLRALTKSLPEVLACHHVTWSDSYVLTVAAASVKHLESLVERLGRYGTPTTSVILSSPVEARAVDLRAAHARAGASHSRRS